VAVRKVDLRAYPRFWMDFAQRCADIDPSMAMSPYQVKRYLQDWYGITVHVTSSSEYTQIYMLEKDYTGFILQWS
jgi:hypothetical protein